MTIQERTINITYKNTTRPIRFVYNDSYFKISSFQVTTRVLYEFKDLIPDYQKYAEMTMRFDIYKDTEAVLKLPALEFNFTVITIGHGTIEVKIDNSYNNTLITNDKIKDELERQIGIPRECIQLCKEDGEEFFNIGCYDNDKMTLYAVITSFEDEVLQKGHEILDYKSVFKVGKTMSVIKVGQIGNYSIIKFYEGYDEIVKRTPKTVVTQDDERIFIKQSPLGEYIKSAGRVLVFKPDNIEYGKEYAISV